MQERLDELKTLLGRVQDLNAAAAVLEWDQQVLMPRLVAFSAALPRPVGIAAVLAFFQFQKSNYNF